MGPPTTPLPYLRGNLGRGRRDRGRPERGADPRPPFLSRATGTGDRRLGESAGPAGASPPATGSISPYSARRVAIGPPRGLPPRCSPGQHQKRLNSRCRLLANRKNVVLQPWRRPPTRRPAVRRGMDAVVAFCSRPGRTSRPTCSDGAELRAFGRILSPGMRSDALGAHSLMDDGSRATEGPVVSTPARRGPCPPVAIGTNSHRSCQRIRDRPRRRAAPGCNSNDPWSGAAVAAAVHLRAGCGTWRPISRQFLADAGISPSGSPPPGRRCSRCCSAPTPGRGGLYYSPPEAPAAGRSSPGVRDLIADRPKEGRWRPR